MGDSPFVEHEVMEREDLESGTVAALEQQTRGPHVVAKESGTVDFVGSGVAFQPQVSTVKYPQVQGHRETQHSDETQRSNHYIRLRHN